MKLHDVSFFCDHEEGPKAVIDLQSINDSWPITLRINQDGKYLGSPRIIIHLASEQNLLDFIASLQSQFDKYLEGKERQENV